MDDQECSKFRFLERLNPIFN